MVMSLLSLPMGILGTVAANLLWAARDAHSGCLLLPPCDRMDASKI